MQLMSIEDLALYLGVSKRTVYKYLADGDCPPYIKLSAKNISFDRADVDAWLVSKKVYPENGGERMRNPDTPCDTKSEQPSNADTLPWTPRARAVLNAARRQAREDGFTIVGTEHLLLGMLTVRKSLGASILERLGVSPQECWQRYRATLQPTENRGRNRVRLSDDVEKVTQEACRQAMQWGHTYIGAEHLLTGVLMTERGVGFRILSDLGVTLDRVRTEAAGLIVCRQAADK